MDDRELLKNKEKTPEEQRRLMREKILRDYAAAQDDTAVKTAQETADRKSTMSGIFEGLEGFARAKGVAAGGRGVDHSKYASQRASFQDQVKSAQAAQKAKVDGVLGEVSLNRDLDAGDNAFAAEGRAKAAEGREATSFNQAQELRERENRADSPESKIAQSLQARMNGGKSDPTLTAAAFKANGGMMAKVYDMELQKSIADGKLGVDYARLAFDKKKAADEAATKAANPAKNPGLDKLDRDFSGNYNDWTSDGKVSAETGLAKLKQAEKDLRAEMAKGSNLTGNTVGRLPDWFKSEKGKELRSTVQSSALGTMKAIFGPNPTEGERAMLLSTQWDDTQSEEANLKRIQDTIADLEARKAAKEAKARYYEANNNTLEGYVPSGQTSGGQKTIVKKFVSKDGTKTKVEYSDGTSEVLQGAQ